MTPEEQEALSKRYVTAAIVTPLENGKFAVFANDRTAESLVIVDDIGLSIVIRDRANRPGVARYLPQTKMRAAVVPQAIDDGTTPDDYGI